MLIKNKWIAILNSWLNICQSSATFWKGKILKTENISNNIHLNLYISLPFRLIVSNYMYSFLAPFQVRPTIHVSIIVKQNNGKILWKKLNPYKLGESIQIRWLANTIHLLKFIHWKCSAIQYKDSFTFSTIVQTFFFCLIPTGIASKLLDFLTLLWNSRNIAHQKEVHSRNDI